MKDENDEVPGNEGEEMESGPGDEVDAEAKQIINKAMDDSVIQKNQEKAILQDDDRVTIIVHNQEGAIGMQPVFVAVNGVGFSIPREKKVRVPKSIVHALENASETIYFKELDDDGRPHGPTLSREVRRFPFSTYNA